MLEPKTAQRLRPVNDSTHASLFATIGFFVLRTPLLPFDEFSKWGSGLRSAMVFRENHDTHATEIAWRHDIELLRKRLGRITDRPEVRQALFLASASLESSVDSWRLDPDTKKGLQTERALTRYFGRMTHRATPFGTLAGYSVGLVKDSWSGIPRVGLSLDSRYRYVLTSRLDYDFLYELTSRLQRMPEVETRLRYWPNSSLCQIGADWHYTKADTSIGQRAHHAVKLHDQVHLSPIIESARSGATIHELTQVLLQQPADPVLSDQEAREYLHELISEQVLVSQLSPLVTTTGESALDELIAQLELLQPDSRVASVLRAAKDDLGDLDQRGLGVLRPVYEQIAAPLNTLPLNVDVSRLIQTDMRKPLIHGTLTSEPISIVTQALGLLATSEVMSPQEPRKLRRFREAFVSRYGQRWVPLLTALNEDVGIGFDSADEEVPAEGFDGWERGKNRRQSATSTFYARLLEKIAECAAQGTRELTLDPSDLAIDGSRQPHEPEGLSVMFTLVAESAAHIQKGDFQVYLRSTKGPTGAALLTRFCHADKELHEWVQQQLRAEESVSDDAVYAEIVHLPEGRLGNIVCRPILRDYEIPYLGRSGISEDRQLPASDLLVTIADQQVVLYSSRLKKRVIPRLTTAHSFDSPGFPPVYRFLGYLQHSRKSEIRVFDWGPLAELPFLPRVRLGSVVLSPARWQLSSAELSALADDNRSASFVAVQQFRQSKRLPRFLLLEDDDNALPVDLDNPLSIDAFLHAARRMDNCVLIEMYPAPDQFCVSGPEGRFHHEIILPLIRRPEAVQTNSTSAHPNMRWLGSNLEYRASNRTYPPGSEWLFLKLYGGRATLDRLLVHEVRQLIATASADSLMSSWFFIRYADPHPHLRLRFHGEPEKLTQCLLPLASKMLSPLVDSVLWKIELGTYVQEVERYAGIEGVKESEHLFFSDSEAVLSILDLFKTEYDLNTRIQIGVMGADRLFRDCKLGMAERLKTARRLRDAFARELQLDTSHRHSLGEQFRQHRHVLEALISDSGDTHCTWHLRETFSILNTRSILIASSIEHLQAIERADPEAVSLTDLAVSYVHMHINRLMRSHARRQEAVVYDFLARLYRMIDAKHRMVDDGVRT